MFHTVVGIGSVGNVCVCLCMCVRAYVCVGMCMCIHMYILQHKQIPIYNLQRFVYNPEASTNVFYNTGMSLVNDDTCNKLATFTVLSHTCNSLCSQRVFKYAYFSYSKLHMWGTKTIQI